MMQPQEGDFQVGRRYRKPPVDPSVYSKTITFLKPEAELIHLSDAILVNQQFSNAIRWQEGERLGDILEACCDYYAESNRELLAVSTESEALSFRELDERANQYARFFLRQGLRAGDRVGVLLSKSVATYASLFALLKLNIAYVPLDASFPADRVAFIAKDAELKAIITLKKFQKALVTVLLGFIFVDASQPEIRMQSSSRLSPVEKAGPLDELCYIIYTSGSTGNPKGVAVDHPSICNFVKVATEVYGIHQGDRMFQGLTIAFDFSVEEIIVPLLSGATLVPGDPDATLVANELADFLIRHQVTALCCVPTLLATIDKDVPGLRWLLVSGEACPYDLVERWYRPGRVMLNAYGPTEATVTATLREMYPGQAVTIGAPLPTYTIVILDENQNLLPRGKEGEIGIAGIGLAKGYVNLEERTRQSFVPDLLNLPDNPSKRIYRTGDLGRITESNEVEYLGRIDTQVKIRGYRIELSEIESVLLELPEIAQAVVTTQKSNGDLTELIAYYTLKECISQFPLEASIARLRDRLPSYMIPSYLEELPFIPMLPSHKADRKRLPPPKGPRLGMGSGQFVAAETELEKKLALVLARVLNLDQVSTSDHFFDNLGAHSLLMAQFSAELKKEMPNLDLSIRDIYLNPTVSKLASLLQSKLGVERKNVRNEPYLKPDRLSYISCGLAQLGASVGYLLLSFWLLLKGLEWAFLTTDMVFLFVRLLVISHLSFAYLTLMPVALKWLLIGRWREERFPVWGVKYFRFWLVKQLLQINPINLFKGTAIYNLYLNLLGANIGVNSVILAKSVSICSDLLSLGDNTVVRKGSVLSGYKAQGGYIYTGAVNIAENCFVGEGSLLDIRTRMDKGAQLGHASSLQEGQHLLAGKRYHGSPAVETATQFQLLEPRACSAFKRAMFSLFQVLSFVFLPVIGLFIERQIDTPLINHDVFLQGDFYQLIQDIRLFIVNQYALGDLFELSFIVYFASLGISLFLVAVVPRFLQVFFQEGQTYSLFGLHYFLLRSITRLSNNRFFNLLFGDSSYILYYLRLIGYQVSMKGQTGSNFGTRQNHDLPFFCEIGQGTMVSDGLNLLNAQVSSNSFKVARVRIQENSFFGILIHYPADAKMGKNCLFGTKTMIPIDGPVRENIGLLGSPAFEIPRSVERDLGVQAYNDPQIKARQIAKKNLFNLVSIAIVLAIRWFFSYIVLLLSYLALVTVDHIGAWALAGLLLILPLSSLTYFILVEHLGLAMLQKMPKLVSIYEAPFWRVEHYWKMNEALLMALFKGTPFKNIISSLLGIKVGKMVFDDGCFVTEKMLVSIGDYCTLNDHSILQSHSLEDGVFKSGSIHLGQGTTVGTNTLIHYDVTTASNVIIGPESFLMKGSKPTPHSRWQGNPASGN